MGRYRSRFICRAMPLGSVRDANVGIHIFGSPSSSGGCGINPPDPAQPETATAPAAASAGKGHGQRPHPGPPHGVTPTGWMCSTTRLSGVRYVVAKRLMSSGFTAA